MSSDSSAGGGKSGSTPTGSTQLSPKTQQASSGVVDREKWRFQVKSNENSLRQSMISYLELQDHLTDSYTDIKQVQDRDGATWLGIRENGRSMYLPTAVGDEKIDQVLFTLEGTVTDPRVHAALYELWLTTKSKAMNEKDRDALIKVYARRLGAYPPEIVQLVLHDLSESAQFFPAWKEIADAMQPLCGWRANYAKALRRAKKRRKT